VPRDVEEGLAADYAAAVNNLPTAVRPHSPERKNQTVPV